MAPCPAVLLSHARAAQQATLSHGRPSGPPQYSSSAASNLEGPISAPIVPSAAPPAATALCPSCRLAALRPLSPPAAAALQPAR
eukprot:1637717-Prymnesium_polylepis.1